MIHGAIFDFDGTLIDSNPYWSEVPKLYLRSFNKEPKPDLDETIFDMTLPEAADYLINEYGLNRTSQQVIDEVNAIMERFYLHDIPLKLGVDTFLDTLCKKGISLMIASVSDKYLINCVLNRFGIRDKFCGIVTTGEVGAGKHEADIYLRAAEYMGCEPENTLVFEDALYAIRTANNAGFKTVGVYDYENERFKDEISAISTFYLMNFCYPDIIYEAIDK